MKWFTRKKSPDDDPASIGRMLRDIGMISDEELERALAAQREHQDRLLGEILVAQGLDQGVVDAVLRIQEARRQKDVGKVVELVCEQTKKVNELHDVFINGAPVRKVTT